MVNSSFSVKGESDELKVSGRRRLRGRSAWPLIVAVVGVVTLGAMLTGFASPPVAERETKVTDQYVENFSIFKAEGPVADAAYVTYLKKDSYLSGVNSAVAFHYASGAKPTVVRIWSKWPDGETKLFTNDVFRFGPIRKIEFWGTAREVSVKDGKNVATRVTFAGQKTFQE